MEETKKLGQQGEELAAGYLRQRGYEIVGANIRSGRRELDLVARRKGWLVFVEVKTRLQTADSLQENPLTSQQTENLKRIIWDYCRPRGIGLEPVRLDLIVILADKSLGLARLRHYRDIF